MAFSTETKRRGILGILPVPDGTIDAADRRHVLWILPEPLTSLAVELGVLGHIDQQRAVAGDNARTPAFLGHIDQQRLIDAER